MSKIKILVAEDEAAIREFIIINLVRAGYDVVEPAVDSNKGETSTLLISSQ